MDDCNDSWNKVTLSYFKNKLMDSGRDLQPTKNGKINDAKTTTDGRPPSDKTYIISSFDASVYNEPDEVPVIESNQLEDPDVAEKDYYEWEKGLAIIINNENFRHHKKREGTNCDERTLTQALEMYHFTVQVVKDGTVKEIEEALITIGEKNSYDCVVVTVLSHGNYGDKLQAQDAEYSKEMLWEMLNGKHCPHLIGKPKLVIIQACRGKESSEATQRIQTDSHRIPTNEITLPVEADILTSYSTFEGHVSFRDTEKGTWYIQELCSEILQNGGTHDFITLLTRVNNKVAQKENEGIHRHRNVIQKQMPVIQSTLTKVLYLTGTKPGLEQQALASILQANSEKLDMLLALTDKSATSSAASNFTIAKPGIRWSCLKLSPTLTKNNSPPDSASVLKAAKLLQKFLQDKTVVPQLKSDVAAHGSLLVNHVYYWECMETSERCATYDLLVKFITTHAKAWQQYKSFDEFQLGKRNITDAKRSPALVAKRSPGVAKRPF